MQRSRSHRRTGPALSAALAAMVATTGPAAAAGYTLDIGGQAQEQSNWCWAATGNTIADYHGVSVSQNTFCNLAFNRSTSYACPNDQATLGNDQTAFRALGISPGSYVGYPVSFPTVVTDIDAHRPINTRIQWSSGGGHMMSIYGYDSTSQYVRWYNPWPSDSRYSYGSYAWYRANSGFSWTHSLYRIGA